MVKLTPWLIGPSSQAAYSLHQTYKLFRSRVVSRVVSEDMVMPEDMHLSTSFAAQYDTDANDKFSQMNRIIHSAEGWANASSFMNHKGQTGRWSISTTAMI